MDRCSSICYATAFSFILVFQLLLIFLSVLGFCWTFDYLWLLVRNFLLFRLGFVGLDWMVQLLLSLRAVFSVAHYDALVLYRGLDLRYKYFGHSGHDCRHL